SGTTGGIGVIGSGTAVASTSGTSIDFTGIPAGVKRVTVMLNGVSTNGNSQAYLQIGSGSVTSSGYTSTCGWVSGSNSCSLGTATAGYYLAPTGSSSDVKSGNAILTNVSGNIWVMSANIKCGTGLVSFSGGEVTLGGTLDRVRITTAGGTDTFDAGSINILYE
ncbi:MAG: hypothetical protein ACR2IJ_01200, partial [Fluviibacter sp.]